MSRSRPGRRLSPILIPGEPTSSMFQRIVGWFHRILLESVDRRASREGELPAGGERSNDSQAQAPRADARPAPAALPLGPVVSPAVSGGPIHRTTTELLPGRLQPLDPPVIEQEVRFVRVGASGTAQVVTLGWDIDPPPGHVTLDHPSIQPRHARMTYHGDHWMIESLVDSDPVEVNGTELLVAGVPRLLSDGDQVRLGTVLFRFVFP